MKVAISGASGLIGTALVAHLRASGHQALCLVRKPSSKPDELSWDPAHGTLDPAALAGIDAFVNLSGESLAERWSEEKKKQFRESRLKTTELIVRTLSAMPQKPKVLVSASAIGIYGQNRGDEELDESSGLGSDFLANLAQDWEKASAPAADADIRVINPRFGLVLHPSGGVLEKLLLPFKLGAGGKVGSGDQWYSWISRTDHVAAILFLIEQSVIGGPVNLTAPHPVTNEEFAKELGKALHRPSVAAVPAPVIRMMLGKEMADSTVLASQRVFPKRLVSAGFEFRFPTLADALEWELRV